MNCPLLPLRLCKKQATFVAALAFLSLSACGSSADGPATTQQQFDTSTSPTQATQSEDTSPASEIADAGSVSITKGADASSYCQGNGACGFVRVTINDLTEPYTITMYDSYGGWGPSGCSYNNSNTTSEYCYYGFPGSQVYVMVNGVKSDIITW